MEDVIDFIFIATIAGSFLLLFGIVIKLFYMLFKNIDDFLGR